MKLPHIGTAWGQYINDPYINQGAKLLFKGVAAYCVFKSSASKNALYSAVVVTVSSEIKSQACSFLADKLYTHLNRNGNYQAAVTSINGKVQSFLEKIRCELPEKVQKSLTITSEALQKIVIAQALSVPLSHISKMVLSGLGIRTSLRMKVETLILNEIILPFVFAKRCV